MTSCPCELLLLSVLLLVVAAELLLLTPDTAAATATAPSAAPPAGPPAAVPVAATEVKLLPVMTPELMIQPLPAKWRLLVDAPES